MSYIHGFLCCDELIWLLNRYHFQLKYKWLEYSRSLFFFPYAKKYVNLCCRHFPHLDHTLSFSHLLIYPLSFITSEYYLSSQTDTSRGFKFIVVYRHAYHNHMNLLPSSEKIPYTKLKNVYIKCNLCTAEQVVFNVPHFGLK